MQIDDEVRMKTPLKPPTIQDYKPLELFPQQNGPKSLPKNKSRAHISNQQSSFSKHGSSFVLKQMSYNQNTDHFPKNKSRNIKLLYSGSSRSNIFSVYHNKVVGSPMTNIKSKILRNRRKTCSTQQQSNDQLMQ